MFYKHWKKIALTLTALFWAACEDSTSAEECLYGPPSYYGLPESSDANEDESSSSEATGNETSSSSSEAAKSESSSSMGKLSSSDKDWSSSSFSAVYAPPTVFCYNDTAVNDSGKVFDIVVCDNGEKYLRFQSLYMDIPEKQKELPKGVNPVPPAPDSIYARNCTREPDICIDAFTIDENGNEQPVGGCYPSINCPEKPQN